MAHWIESEWMSRHPDRDLLTFWAANACLEEDVLLEFERALPQGFRFSGFEQIDCPLIARTNLYDHEDQVTYRTGAFVLRFENADETVEALVTGSHYSDNSWYQLT
ncbi:MAG: hypothetical protein K8L99_28185, partial [Anaerolineae bacterium]|nr:hypothetical protein [Anaerolineae bacterium]